MELRTYQSEALLSIINGYKNGNKNQLLVLPTGSGKTFIFAHLIKKLDYKALIVSHTDELKRQNFDTCYRVLQKKNFDSQTIQWIHRKDSYSFLDEENYDMLIVDEAHHAASESYRETIEHFTKKGKLVLGCTATPFRLDNKSVYEIFPYIAYEKNIIEMIDLGYLCDIKGFRIKTDIDISKVKKTRGEYNLKQLSTVINTINRNQLIYDSFKKISFNKKTLIFCTSIKHAEDVASTFRANGILCLAVHGKLHRNERQKILHDFKTGKVQVITNCQILTEGFDEPSIETLIMARPTKSPALYIQMIGRGLRKHEQKNNCIVIELTDNDHDICDFRTCIDGLRHNDSFDDYEEGAGFEKIRGSSNRNPIFGQRLIVNEMNFVNKYEKKFNEQATEIQKQMLSVLGIDFIEPLSYEMADIIIRNHTRR